MALGKELQRLLEKLHAGHARHPLVDQEQRDRLAARVELVHRLQRRRAGVGAHHAVALAILPAQVALDRAEHLGIVVNRQDHRFFHARCGRYPAEGKSTTRNGGESVNSESGAKRSCQRAETDFRHKCRVRRRGARICAGAFSRVKRLWHLEC